MLTDIVNYSDFSTELLKLLSNFTIHYSEEAKILLKKEKSFYLSKMKKLGLSRQKSKILVASDFQVPNEDEQKHEFGEFTED